jgi:excisionase family DNA binding protein
MPQDTTVRLPEGGLLDGVAAAAYLGTTPRHIYRLWSERKLSGRKIGRKVRFSKADLDEFAERNRVRAVQ